MKRKVIVEIEYPDNRDACWDSDVSGIQAFGDIVQLMAMHGVMDMMSIAIERCKSEPTKERYQAYKEYIEIKLNTISTMKAIGYVSEEGNTYFHDRVTDKFEKVN